MKLLVILASLCFSITTAVAQEGWVRKPCDPRDNLESVFFINKDHGWAVGSSNVAGHEGVILKTTDGGDSWALKLHHPDAAFCSVFFADDETGMAVGHERMTNGAYNIHMTADGGETWFALDSGMPMLWYSLRSVFLLSPSVGWTVGDMGTILKTTDYGATWSMQPSGTEQTLLSIHFASTSLGWAVGGKAMIKTTDGGMHWRDVSGNVFQGKPSPWMSSVFFIDVNIGWVVGYQLLFPKSVGVILKTTDAGETWTSCATGLFPDLSSVCFIDAKTGWAVGSQGTIIKSTDGGITWHKQVSGSSELLWSAFFCTPNNGWAVGSRTILKTTTGGEANVVRIKPEVGLPNKAALLQNFPNPFNSKTGVSYQLPVASTVRLVVYDLLGREVATLVEENKAPGTYTVQFDASDLASGVYLYRMTVGSFVETRKLVLLR